MLRKRDRQAVIRDKDHGHKNAYKQEQGRSVIQHLSIRSCSTQTAASTVSSRFSSVKNYLPEVRHVLTGIGLLVMYLWVNATFMSRPVEINGQAPVITLASSSARLQSNELAVTLRSLLRQSFPPSEIRVYITDEDRETFELYASTKSCRATAYLNMDVIKLHYVPNLGPATKYLYAIQDLLLAGHLDQPLVVLGMFISWSVAASRC